MTDAHDTDRLIELVQNALAEADNQQDTLAAALLTEVLSAVRERARKRP